MRISRCWRRSYATWILRCSVLGLLPDMKSEEAMSSTISTIQTARKKTPSPFSNAALKIIIYFTIAKNLELGRTMLITIFSILLSLITFVSAIGRPSCLVTHCTSRGASIRATLPPFESHAALDANVFYPEKLWRSLSENTRSGGRGTFTRLGTVCRGGCDRQCSPRAFEHMRT